MPGYKVWQRLEELTSDDMNGYLGSQVVATFESAAQRSAEMPAPDGSVLTRLLDTGAVEAFYGAGIGWAPPWQMPWGMTQPHGGLATHKADQTVSGTTWRDVDGLTVPAVDFIPGRLYRLDVCLHLVTYQQPQVSTFLCQVVPGNGSAAIDMPDQFMDVTDAVVYAPSYVRAATGGTGDLVVQARMSKSTESCVIKGTKSDSQVMVSDVGTTVGAP